MGESSNILERSVPLKEYYCDEHHREKLIINFEGFATIYCPICISENSTKQTIRHKLYSNLTKSWLIYFSLMFSIIFSFISLLSEFLDVLGVLDAFSRNSIFGAKIIFTLTLFGLLEIILFPNFSKGVH